MASVCKTAQTSLFSSQKSLSARSPPLSSPRVSCRVVVARAEVARVKPPAGVTLPPQEPQVPPPTFGFVSFAEKINSRACMIGFFALLAVEGITGKGLLELIGINIGNGLGFEL